MIKEFEISFHNQWSQFYHKLNWYVVNLINIEIEKEDYLGCFYVEITLIGFGLRLSWLYNEDTPARKRLEKYIKKNDNTSKRSSKKNV